jgi:hypothetical protein
MKIVRYLLVVLCVVALVSSVAIAQDLSQQLAAMSGAAAISYTAPLLNGWGVGLNSAFYHSANLHDVLGFDIGIKATFFQWKDGDKTYNFQMPDHINVYNPYSTSIQYVLHPGTDYPASVVAQTVAGEKTETVVKTFQTSAYSNQEIFKLPGGLGTPGAGLIVPQAAIGLPFGLEIVGRFIPTYTFTGVGKINFMGFGLRYNVDQWIPVCPVDIAIHFMTQKFNFKDSSDNNLISASATAYGVEVSKKLLIFTLYGGFQLEKAKFTIGPYDAKITSGNTTIPLHVDAFDFESNNKSRFTVGVRLLLLILNVHAEYSVAKTPMFAAGVGISIR